MTGHINSLQNNILENFGTRAPQKVINAIHTASKRSGVDFSYLVNQASVESSFNPQAKAKTSSATGLFQFIDSTWMDMVNRHGEKYGLDTNGMSKREILDLRKDPEASSFMAAAFASDNEKFLNRHWGGEIGSTELYLAHFMGASGATSFLKARDDNPLTPAADLFPKAARANRNVFYNSQTGQPRSLEQVYALFDKKFQNTLETKNFDIAQAPLPPEMPDRKLTDEIQNLENKRTDFIRTAINKNNLVMLRAQAMRDDAKHGIRDYLDNPASVTGQHNNSIPESFLKQRIANESYGSSAFFNQMHKPLNTLLLSQEKPNMVIRDNA